MKFQIDWQTLATGALLVRGYPDGSDWIVSPNGEAIENAGLVDKGQASANIAWVETKAISATGDERAIILLDLVNRRRIGRSFEFGGLFAGRVQPSRNGEYLFVVENDHEYPHGQRRVHVGGKLTVISVSTGDVLSEHKFACRGLSLWKAPIAETDEGQLAFPILADKPEAQSKHELDKSLLAVMWIDPLNGKHETVLTPIEHFAGPVMSPKGRYALMIDYSRIPTRTAKTNSILGFLKRGVSETYYGLCVQLWDMQKMTFIRSFPVAWFTFDELPSDCHRPPRKRALYETLLERLARKSPDDHTPLVTSIELQEHGSEEYYIANLHQEFARLGRYIWSPDEKSFWVKVHGFWSWVSIDGQCSPRLRLARTGKKQGMVVPFAVDPCVMRPLGGQRAEWDFRVEGQTNSPIGVATIEAPLPQRFTPIQVISERNDNWRHGQPISRDMYARGHAATAAMSKVSVKLKDLSAEQCIKAIERITRNLKKYAADSLRGDNLQFAFETPERTLSEPQFYQHVEDNVPDAVPALQGLVRKVISGEATPIGNFMLPWSGDGQLAGGAVKALGVLDPKSLPLVEQYYKKIDDHNGEFSIETLPSIFAAHGWVPETIDLAAMLMVSEDDAGHSDWVDKGLREAVADAYSPEAFADKIAAIIRKTGPEEQWQFGHYNLCEIYRNLESKSVWEIAFFDRLDALFPAYEEAANKAA